MKKVKAILCGYYGFGNIGDEALLCCLIKMLPSYISPIVLSSNCESTFQLHNVESCDRENIMEIIHAIASAQVFIWGGGGLISDATSVITPLYYSGLMQLAQMAELKTIAWAQGIGPLYKDLSKSIAEKTFKQCTAISLRDSSSEDILREWRISSITAPDPVWSLEAKPFMRGKNLPSPCVAVVLRNHPRLTPGRLQLLTHALKKFQVESKAYILFIPFYIAQDLPIAEKMHALCKENSEILLITNPQEMKGVFQNVDMTIAMRLHGLIMAAAEKSRCFAISYAPKVRQLMKDIDCPGWDINCIPSDKNDIVKAWLDCLFNYELSPAKISDQCFRSQEHQTILYDTL